MILSSYAGLRGAVGLALALMVSASDKVPKYVQEVILLHVGLVAILTLLINATTTGYLVKKLGLSNQSDLQKNILVGITHQLDKNVEDNIDILKMKRYFNQVEWPKLKEAINLVDIKNNLSQFKSLKIS